MAMQDLMSFLDDDTLETPPIKSKLFPDGKVYKIQSPDAETGLRLNSLATLAAKAAGGADVSKDDISKLKLSDDEERGFMQQVLGTVYDEMLTDGVSWVTIQRLTQYAFAYFAVSPQAANKGVESGAFSGKAPTPNRAARRAASTGAKSPKSPALAGSKKPKAAG